jgi:hypothetical protein
MAAQSSSSLRSINSSSNNNPSRKRKLVLASEDPGIAIGVEPRSVNEALQDNTELNTVFHNVHDIIEGIVGTASEHIVSVMEQTYPAKVYIKALVAQLSTRLQSEEHREKGLRVIPDYTQPIMLDGVILDSISVDIAICNPTTVLTLIDVKSKKTLKSDDARSGLAVAEQIKLATGLPQMQCPPVIVVNFLEGMTNKICSRLDGSINGVMVPGGVDA